MGRNQWPLWALVLIFVVGHLPFLGSPYVNLEWSYAGSARLLAEGKFDDATRYLAENVANPLGTSAGVACFFLVSPASELSSRLYPLACGSALIVLLGLFVYRSASPYGIDRSCALLAATLVGFNPLFWVYSGNVASDVPFTFLITSAILTALVACRRRSWPMHACAAVLLALAGLTKYNAVAFIPVVAGMAIAEGRFAGRTPRDRMLRGAMVLAIYAGIGCALTVPYLLHTTSVLGHVIDPQAVQFLGLLPNERTILFAPGRLADLVAWIGMIAGPFVFVPLAQMHARSSGKRSAYVVGALFVIAAAGAALVVHFTTNYDDFGEMELGWMRHFLAGFGALWAAYTVLCMAGCTVLYAFVRWTLDNPRARYWLLLWFGSFLAVHCLEKASNRYILFVLPPLALYLGDGLLAGFRTSGSRRYYAPAAVAAFLIFASVCVFNSAYYAAEGRGAARLASFVNEHRLPVADGDVLAHCTYLIDKDLLDEKHGRYGLVSLSRHDGGEHVIFSAPISVGGVLLRRFAVVPIQ